MNTNGMKPTPSAGGALRGARSQAPRHALIPAGAAAFLLALSAAEVRASNGYWDPQINIYSNSTELGMVAAGSEFKGVYNIGTTFNIKRAGINAWSDNNMAWNNTYFRYRVYAQDRNPSEATVNLPRTGGSGNDHYFGWNTDINLAMKANITYNGTYTIAYRYSYDDNAGTAYTGYYYPTFTVVGTNYLVTNGTASVNQDAFNGGASTLVGTGCKLVMQGANTLTLNASNTFTGNTYIDRGTVSLSHNGGAGPGGIFVGAEGGSDAATLYLTGGRTATNSVTVRSGSSGTMTLGSADGSGNNVFSGGITLSKATTVTAASGGTVTFAGAVGGANALSKIGAGTLVLSNNNSFSGGFNVWAGMARITNSVNAMGAGTVNVGTNATLALGNGTVTMGSVALNLYNGLVSKADGATITWPGALTNVGASTVSVTRSTLNFSGGIAISSGTLTFSNTVAAGMGSGGTMTGSGTFAKNGSGLFNFYPGTHSGDISLNQGEIRQYPTAMTASGTLTMQGGAKYSASGTTRTNTKAVAINGNVGLSENSGTTMLFTGNINLNAGTRILTNTADAVLSGVVSNGGLEKKGAGTMTLSGANDYASGTTITEGILQIGAGSTSGSVINNIANNAALVWNRSDSPTYAGQISGTGTLTKQGAGTLTLSGTSGMSGATTVSAGTLLVSGSLASAISVSGGATLAGAGTVGSIASLAGTVSPGNTAGVAGTLTLTGAAALGGGAYTCDITGTGSTACDLISASGAVAAGSALTINLPTSAPAGFSGWTSYSWTILSGSSASAANMSIGTQWAADGVFGVSASGNNIVATYTAPVPAAPAGLTASDGTSTAQVALSWGNVDGETGFVIWRHTADVFGSATAIYTNAADTLTYNDAGAAAGQQYYYWVTATNGSGSGPESASNGGYKRLTAPGNLAATDGSSTANIAVTWDAATGASAYYLYRDTDSDPAGATALGAQTSGYADAPTPGQLYYYWVMASNTTSSSTSDWSAADGGYRKLAAVSLTAASDDQTTGITVTWLDVAGETGYGLWRSETSDTSTAACVTTAAADATSKEDTSAVAGTTYNYWVRATNSTSASMGEFSNTDTGLRVLTEPSKPASNLVFSALATDSMAVGWKRGDGNFVLVVAKQGAAPAAPANTTVYGADATFGLGDPTEIGSYVVYKGADTNVTVAGLSPATEYYFAAYEFNGADTPTYRFTGAPVSSRFTLMTEPTVQATNLLFSAINTASLGVNWTAGNGAGRLVVMKAGGAVSVFPSDGATNAFTATFGTGYANLGDGNYAVYAGDGTNVTVSGLANDTVYHLRVFEYGGTNTTINYNTNAAPRNPISQTTMAANPGSNPTDLTISSIGTNVFTVSWTKGTTGTNTLIAIRAGNYPSDPVDLTSYTADPVFGGGTDLGSGSHVVYNGTGSSVTVTNLTPGARYYVEASSFNGSGGSENYRATPTSTDGTTLMPKPSQASGIAFGTLAATSYAVSYTAGGGLSRLVVAKAGGAVDWTPTNGTAYSGEHTNIASAADLGGGNLLVKRGASPFTLAGLSPATDYHLRIFEYQGTNATLNYNTDAASGNPSNRYTLSAEPTAHGTLAATALSDTNIGLSWGAAAGESGFVIVRQTSDSGWTAPSDGTAYSVGAGLGGTIVYAGTAAGAGAATDTLLSASTPYYYRIYPYAYDGTPAHATYNYYAGGTPGSASATTGPAEPSTSSTLTSFLPASGASATIVWTNTGSADGSILLMKSGGAVGANPADWTNYLASLTFAGGDQIGAGNYVVVTGAFKHGTATVTGLTAGTTYHVAVYPYNGSGSFLNYRTASPATGSATILPDPTAATATADGKTMVRLAWMTNAAYNSVMIVHKSGSASTAPTQGSGYNAGDACGGGTVIYKGSGTNLERVVASGTAHHFAFYTYSGNYYSAGVAADASTTAFASGAIVETFSYTNNSALTGLNGETGWGGAWYGDTGSYTNQTSTGSFAEQTNYPTPSGNKLFTYPPNDTSRSIYRWLGTDYKSGRLYFGFVQNYTWSGANKFTGLSLFYTNTSEKLFVGEIYASDQILGIDSTASSYGLTAGSGNNYVIVGYYDWAAGAAKVKAYKVGSQAVPTDEPSAWDLTLSKSSNTVGWVNTIRLASGAGSGYGTPGNTYFDEVRVATNWSGLIGALPSKPGDPSGPSATADGNEMARLAWTKHADGHSVMILHGTAAISTDPTDSVGYGVGDSIGGATVAYKGSGTAVEHVVAAGTTNYYKFYSYSGSDYYSTGVTATVTNGAYTAYEKVNPFSYTNGATLGSSMRGGQGFGANYWATGGSGTWYARTNNATAESDTPKFTSMTGYPAMAGNLAFVDGLTSDGTSGYAERDIAAAVSTGNFYVAFMMAYQFQGASKWAGLSLMNGSTEKAFFGKGGGANWTTLAAAGGGGTYWSSFDLLPFGGGSGDTGNVYMVVGKYNFESKLLQTKAWRIFGNEFPGTEPSTWDASGTLGTGIDQITRFRLNVGASGGAGWIGRVFFDEIRYGTEWSHLLATTCPTWAGSNSINSAAWTAATNAWLGNTESFQFQSYPPGLGQSAAIAFDWAKDGSFSPSNAMAWWKNENNNSYWSGQVQMTSAGVFTSRFAAAGGSCPAAQTNNPKITVSNLVAPSAATAARDAVNTNSQINLTWTRGTSGVEKDTLIVRRAGAAPGTDPENGRAYNPGDSLGSATVIYRGSGTSFNDTGLAPSTTYYYWFYAENYSYYSSSHATANSNTLAGGQAIVVDGNPADWNGTPSAVINSSASSLQQFIWTDKKGEVRSEHGDHPNGDLSEFRVFADATNVYFLVRMTNIADATKPFVAIGVDTRTNSSSSEMKWIGDDANTFVGDGYAQGGAAHYPERQLNIHHVAAEGGPRIEMFAHDGDSWRSPDSGNTNVAISATHHVVELRVSRADLNLTGEKTARFTVAAFLNTGSWNNDGDGTAHIADNTAGAVDSISIPPWGVPDNAATMSAWLEDLSDGDIDFWLDVKFGAAGLSDNSKPATVALGSPTNTAATTASPNLSWSKSSDTDGQITGYLLEISTNEQFNGVSGTENGSIQQRVHVDANTTNYAFTTSASQYWWRVRARDTAGELSAATTRWFKVVGKLDTEGPQPTLMYIGTNVAGYLAGDSDITNRIAQYGPIQSVLDSEIRDTNNVFGFVLRWDDASGVYATNRAHDELSGGPGAGQFAFNIVSTEGRVSPNWDLTEIDTTAGTTNDWGKDLPFYASNTMATGNSDVSMTNYVRAAFTMTNYNPAIEYYLTVSAEDVYTTDGSWASYGSWKSYTNASGGKYYSGWCKDGPNTMRNVTTNMLIRIEVTDDDVVAPKAATNLAWANEASLVVSNAAGALTYASGTGQEVLYQVTDGGLIGGPLSFSFNAHDSYYKGMALGTDATFASGARTLTNTAFVAAYWQTNWANFSPARSQTGDTRNANTMLTWHWPVITTQDVTKLWGPDSLSGELGVTNLIQLDLFDVDNDRDGDQANARVNFGRIVLVDDDAVDPAVSNETLQVTGTGLASEYILANLVEWDFTGSGDSRLTSTNVAAGVTSSPVSLGPMGTIQGTDAIFANAAYHRPGTNRYWLFSLTPAATDKTFRATSISFDSRVNTLNGPDTIELWGTMPGESEALWASNSIDLSDPDNPLGTNWNSYGTSVGMTLASTGTVQFRLVAYVADTNHLVASANANWYVDNLIVSGYILGQSGGSQVTDNDLAQGRVRVQAAMRDEYSGLFAATNTGLAPRVDFWHAAGVPVTNGFFTNGLASNGAAKAWTTVWGSNLPPADKKTIQGGRTPTNYTARFLINDFDMDRDGDSRVVTNTLAVQVYDNDTNAPVRGFKFGGPLGVFVDGTITKAVSSGYTRDYRINDAQLQAMAFTSLTVKVNLYEFRVWTVPTLSFSNAAAGVLSTNGWLTGLRTDAVNTTNAPDAEMEWTFSKSQAESLFASSESVANEFRVVTAWDKDDDRQDAGGGNIDNKELANVRLGYVTFLDNDTGQPNLQRSYSAARTNWAIPKIFLGLPGAASRSNLLINGDAMLDTNVGTTVLANLTNRVYDSQLAKVSAAAPLSVVLPIYDYGGGGAGRTVTGVKRGTVLTESSTNGSEHVITNSSINIGTVKVQNVSAYRSDLSSSLALTKIAAQAPTSTWAFTSLDYAEVGRWLPAAAASSNHALSATLFDVDDNRPNDQRTTNVAFGTLMVLDNDTVAPTVPTNLTVNGAAATDVLTRATAPWTNQPNFRIRFTPSVDGEPAATDLERSGVGEYRTAIVKSGIGPDLGAPLAVPADGALANYGFESGSACWTLSGASVSTEQAYEGTNSLKMTGSTAQQTVPLGNTNGFAPRVAVRGAQFMGGASVTGAVTVAGLDTNGAAVGGATFTVQIDGAAGQWTGAAAASNTWGATVDQVQVTLTSGANTYWDDIRIQIELLDGGAPVGAASALFVAAEQGLTTNYLFAVDRDNNRPGDRKASSAPADEFIPAFGIAYDITPPTKVPLPANAASTENVGDPTSQFDITWNPALVGPDDLDDNRHPDFPSASDRDKLSPWRTYKVYYGPYDPLNVPPGDLGHGNYSAYIHTNFIVTGAYSNNPAWKSVSSTNAIADPSAATNYLALTNLSQGGIRLFDLDYDQDYAVVVVGVDKAGNEGPAGVSSWATNNTIKFAVTQGMMRSRAQVLSAFPGNHNLTESDRGAASLFWIAAGPTNAQGGYTQVTKDYDLIYFDTNSFRETSNSTWQKVGTIRTNWFADAGGRDVGLVGDRGRMRFYRASYKDRWQRTDPQTGQPRRPLASEDVYAMHSVILAEGYNHVGLHGEPFTNTFLGVFGADTSFWPAASSPAQATKIEFYSSAPNAPVAEVYYFGLDAGVANWYLAGNPTPVTTVPQAPHFFARGFSITLPTNLLARGYATTEVWDFNRGTNVDALVWRPVLKVPTNGPGGGSFSHVINCGEGRPSNVLVYNVVALNLPVALHPKDMFLTNCGFAKGTFGNADEIYTMATEQRRMRDGNKIYCDPAGKWRFGEGNAEVVGPYFKPNDVIVIVSRNGGVDNTWTWTYHPTNFYAPPTRWMGQ